MNDYNRFLVTGGAGFIGSHLVDLLSASDAERIIVVDNFFLGRNSNLINVIDNEKVKVYHEDARYLTAMENIIDREKPEVIFDLAVKPLPYGFIDPEGAYLTSVEIVHNLAHLLRKRKYQKLIHFSSSEAYGTAQYVPMDEKHPIDPLSPYAAGKASADILLSSFHKIFDLNISILRPFNAYGPRQNIGTYAAVIPLSIRRILNNEPPVIEWDGEQTRDFTYVTDIAKAAYKMVNADEAIGKIINVGQGKGTSIKEIVHSICRQLNYPIDGIEYKPMRTGDVRTHLADITLAKQIIKYSPEITLDEGLKRTIDWYKTNMNNISLT